MKSRVNARATFRRTRRALLGCALAALALPAASQAASVDLAVTQTDTPDPVMAGDLLTYAIHVSNAGPDPADNVRLVDTLSNHVEFVSADSTSTSCTGSKRRVVCELGTLASGATQDVTVQVRPEAARHAYGATNVVSVGKRKTDPRPANNDSRISTRVETPPPVFCAGRQATIVGTDGDDDLEGTNGRDVIALLGGSDQVATFEGNDLVCGAGGDDLIRGGGDDDIIRGGGGNDILKGGNGDDRLEGKAGKDLLKGGSGTDLLKGGGGPDVLKGGGGADLCSGGGGSTIKSGC